MVDYGDDPLEEVEYRDELAREIAPVTQAMKKLSYNQRTVLALSFGSEMSCEEIALVLDKKCGTVREMKSAAIRQLRRVMQVS